MKLKTSRVISVLLLIGISFYCSAQTVEEIINKHLEAHGGLEKWSKVDALKLSGNFTAFSVEKDYMCYKTKEGNYYGDFFLGEFNIVEALYGETAWMIDPWQEIPYARKISADELNSFEQKAEFFTPFLNYQEMGHEVEYLGFDTVDGQQMHALKLTRVSGKVENWFLSTDTYLEYSCQSDWVDFARNVPSEVYFDDFRTVDGLVIPFFVERTFLQRDRILIVESMEVNPTIDEILFDMPSRDEMVLLEFLVGDWDVHVEAWTRRGTWYDLGKSNSSIRYASANLLEEKISYNRMLPISKQINYTFNDEGENYKVSIYNELTTGLTIYDGQLTDTSFVFDNKKSICPDQDNTESPVFQYSITSINASGFVLEIKQWDDAGQSWSPRDRFTYSRKQE